jgi:hypothetical protein
MKTETKEKLEMLLVGQGLGFLEGALFGGVGRIIGGRAEIIASAVPLTMSGIIGVAYTLPGYVLGVGIANADRIYYVAQQFLGG